MFISKSLNFKDDHLTEYAALKLDTVKNFIGMTHWNWFVTTIRMIFMFYGQMMVVFFNMGFSVNNKYILIINI